MLCGFQVCRLMYEDAVGIVPEDVVSQREAGKMLGMKLWTVSQLVAEIKLTLLIDVDVPER
jgi:hypothetical protein